MEIQVLSRKRKGIVAERKDDPIAKNDLAKAIDRGVQGISKFERGYECITIT